MCVGVFHDGLYNIGTLRDGQHIQREQIIEYIQQYDTDNDQSKVNTPPRGDGGSGFDGGLVDCLLKAHQANYNAKRMR